MSWLSPVWLIVWQTTACFSRFSKYIFMYSILSPFRLLRMFPCDALGEFVIVRISNGLNADKMWTSCFLYSCTWFIFTRRTRNLWQSCEKVWKIDSWSWESSSACIYYTAKGWQRAASGLVSRASGPSSIVIIYQDSSYWTKIKFYSIKRIRSCERSGHSEGDTTAKKTSVQCKCYRPFGCRMHSLICDLVWPYDTVTRYLRNRAWDSLHNHRR